VAAFVGEVLASHAYVPPSVMPTRDCQPGVVVLPPTVQLPAGDEDGDGDEDADDDAAGATGVQGGYPLALAPAPPLVWYAALELINPFLTLVQLLGCPHSRWGDDCQVEILLWMSPLAERL